MSDMIERLAEAFHKSHGSSLRWHEISEGARDRARHAVRCILAEYRTPTPDMIEAGKSVPMVLGGGFEGYVRHVHEAMIDEALK